MNTWNDIWNDKANTPLDDHNEITGYNNCDNVLQAEEVVNYIIKYCGMSSNERVLDYGCGSGRMGQYFINNYDYYGLDKSSCMINKFRKILKYDKVDVIDSYKLPFPDNHFDVVICYSVIQYLDSLDDVNILLNEFIRVSKRIIYIGDIESIDHSEKNKKGYSVKNNLKHLVVTKNYIESLKLKHELLFNSDHTTRDSRYNLLINK
jgi:ubiquinone/menaquinone biosynthesis C-methylase UbiE